MNCFSIRLYAFCCFTMASLLVFGLIIGSKSKSLYCIHSGGHGEFFSYISTNLNRSGRDPEYKWGVTVCTHTKIQGKLPQGLHLRIPKHVLFCFCKQYNADFRPLILHRFWPLLKKDANQFYFTLKQHFHGLNRNSFKWTPSQFDVYKIMAASESVGSADAVSFADWLADCQGVISGLAVISHYDNICADCK